MKLTLPRIGLRVAAPEPRSPRLPKSPPAPRGDAREPAHVAPVIPLRLVPSLPPLDAPATPAPVSPEGALVDGKHVALAELVEAYRWMTGHDMEVLLDFVQQTKGELYMLRSSEVEVSVRCTLDVTLPEPREVTPALDTQGESAAAEAAKPTRRRKGRKATPPPEGPAERATVDYELTVGDATVRGTYAGDGKEVEHTLTLDVCSGEFELDALTLEVDAHTLYPAWVFARRARYGA